MMERQQLGRLLMVAGMLILALGVLLILSGCAAPQTSQWAGRVDAADPMDLNHREAQARNVHWAAEVKAEKERAAAAEAKRQADAKAAQEAAEAKRQQEAASNPRVQSTPAQPRPANPYVPAPQPQADVWMQTFNAMASSLPGSYVVSDQGAWGATQLDTGQVYIARRTPLANLRSVMIHESCHVRQGRAFGGYYGAVAAMAPYGGIERTADACALNSGASWINYGVDAKARAGARLF